MIIKAKNCIKCKYHYIAEARRTKSFYNALEDGYTTAEITLNQSACGESPGGTLLDAEQPKCSSYEETKT